MHTLTNDEIRRRAPSVFATRAAENTSARYNFVATSDVVEHMRSDGWGVVSAQEQVVRTPERQGFQKHVLRFQRLDTLQKMGTYHPEVVLTNSHDKSSAYCLSAGVYREVCANKMVVAESIFESIHIVHTGFRPEAILEGSRRVIEALPAIHANIGAMQARNLRSDEQNALACQAAALRWGPETIFDSNSLLKPRRSADVGTDLWNTFNRVQENVTLGGFRGRRSGKVLPRTRGLKGLDASLKFNRELWERAQALLS
jgi:hypothetical protein